MHKNQRNEMPQDPVSQQLPNYSRNVQGEDKVIRSGDGLRTDSMVATETVGPHGPVLIQDGNYLNAMQHFDRECIPERVVHAKGAGAFGYFEVTHDITQYSKACVFSKVGKKTPVAVRFSSVTVNAGAADTVRDPRGFAVKFYTEDGNWDLVGNNTPIFFIRDPILFPLFIHSQKRNPVTHIKDRNMFWDFATLRPETTHQMMILFSDRGVPDGFRHMNGYGSHTFKLVNERNEVVYCKFHYKTDQGIKNLSPEDAEKLAGSEPDYALRDLYNAIAEKNFPTWTFYIQVMTLEQASKFRWDPLDVTKVWPKPEYPLMPVGKLVLNLNPKNYFTDVEQVSFNPASVIPGIEPSLDRMLQGRLFAYSDTALHRLGPNYQQIPVNCPYRVRVANYERDGGMNTSDNQDGAPNYYPNTFKGPRPDPSTAKPRSFVSGEVAKYDLIDQDNFSQPALFWNVLDEGARNRLAKNIGTHLSPATPAIKERAVKMFSKVNQEFGVKIAAAMNMQAKSCL